MSLIAITKIRENIIKELASIIPGEPAVHLTAFIQTRIQKKGIYSWNTRDCSIQRLRNVW
jgi:hypothetical protein